MKANASTHNSRSNRPVKWNLLLLLVLFFLAITYYFWQRYQNPETPLADPRQDSPLEPAFEAEGQLVFLDSRGTGDTLRQITIEIADSPAAIERGLMYRTRMSYEIGMLFIFEDERPRSFWMKNTPTALDIIFVDAARQIVSIRENTTPYSEEPVLSEANARYVVEVKAGFCDAFGVAVGDRIYFERSVPEPGQ
ncbi:MAG: DUF192 domain-containing protein [Bacteroidia bacterium]|nr:DUF192 domain-containing protein [Bacteroidia bacterium]